MATFRKAVIALTGGVWDGANQVYSDSNPPETLMHTQTASPAATPGAGLGVTYLNSGVLFHKSAAGTVYRLDNTSVRDFSFVGALSVKAGVARLPIMFPCDIEMVAAMVNTAPTGASVIVDVQKNGTTIYGTQANRPTIAVSTTSAVVGAHSVTSLVAGDYITVDVDQVGSTVAGSDLVVSVAFRRTG